MFKCSCSSAGRRMSSEKPIAIHTRGVVLKISISLESVRFGAMRNVAYATVLFIQCMAMPGNMLPVL